MQRTTWFCKTLCSNCQSIFNTVTVINWLVVVHIYTYWSMYTYIYIYNCWGPQLIGSWYSLCVYHKSTDSLPDHRTAPKRCFDWSSTKYWMIFWIASYIPMFQDRSFQMVFLWRVCWVPSPSWIVQSLRFSLYRSVVFCSNHCLGWQKKCKNSALKSCVLLVKKNMSVRKITCI